MTDEGEPDPDMVIRAETRKRPGPSAYLRGTLVIVKLRNPEGKPSSWYEARVTKSSTQRLYVRVVGTGSELALTTWDVKMFVRRPDEGVPP